MSNQPDVLPRVTPRTESSSPLRDCERRFSGVEKMITKHDVALYGEDGMNGIVSDIKTIKYQTGTIRTAIQAGLSILITITTYYLIKVFGL